MVRIVTRATSGKTYISINEPDTNAQPGARKDGIYCRAVCTKGWLGIPIKGAHLVSGAKSTG